MVEAHRTVGETITVERRYYLTSLAGDAQQFAQAVRSHWGIENGLHYRRDATMREDHAQLRMGHAPQMLAILNNTVLGLFAQLGETNVAQARRAFSYHFDRALAALAA